MATRTAAHAQYDLVCRLSDGVRRGFQRLTPNPTPQCLSTPSEALSFFSAVLARLSLATFVLFGHRGPSFIAGMEAPAERRWPLFRNPIVGKQESKFGQDSIMLESLVAAMSSISARTASFFWQIYRYPSASW
jgi:hypothetical protein